MASLIDDEDNEFPTNSLFVKGEYLTLDDTSRKIDGYVFMYYRLGALVYHFTNLVIGTNIQLQTMTKKILHKVLLPASFRERENYGDY